MSYDWTKEELEEIDRFIKYCEEIHKLKEKKQK